MRTQKLLLTGLFVFGAIVCDGSSKASAEIINTQSHYTVRDELFFHYTSNDLRELSRKVRLKMLSLRENASKKFYNLMSSKWKSQSIVSSAREQRAKIKDQQRSRNQVQQDYLNNIRRKNQDLAWQRADLRHKK